MKTLQEILDFYNEDFRKEYDLYIETDKKSHLVKTIKIVLDYHISEECKNQTKRLENVKYLFSYLIYHPEVVNIADKFKNVLFNKCEILLKDENLDEECKEILNRFNEYRLE